MYSVRIVDGKALAPLLAEFDRELFPTSPRIEPDKGWWWLLYGGDECVGYAGMVPSQQWASTGYLCRAAVDPRHRGQGLQKVLIRRRIQHARKLGYTHLVTDTTDNPASANSLIACGFRLYEPAAPWAFKHSLYWIRRL